MTFDSNRAWNEASRAVSANKEVVLAIAGVFFLLPQLAFTTFFPAPEMASGMTEQQVIDAAKTYYTSILPVMIPVFLCQALGTLSLLCLLDTDRRPTVGEAIGSGLKGLLPYLAAQILMGMGLTAVLLAPAMLLAVGGTAGAVIGLALGFVLVIPVAVRLSLTSPVIAVDGVFNPLHALTRSWQLTRGNTARIFGFYALLSLAMMALLILGNVATLPIALLAPKAIAELAGAVIGSILATVMVLYFVAVIGQIHRQLSGGSAETLTSPFE
ncbi:hypothetical protein EDF56_105112 [Novosphingobium sp. PhB165]|uniref:hypothetical protein n=1 Tax=Novosphingobium sp. PhB165 TaxID=2485105 RepID=UPI0010507638|nr:hypothetical protein [Novosphingobium sp. PhB165]TCM17769.1 hypothetical protein EDF56_105112 [Novosphingobium sp. PhB165]